MLSNTVCELTVNVKTDRRRSLLAGNILSNASKVANVLRNSGWHIMNALTRLECISPTGHSPPISCVTVSDYCCWQSQCRRLHRCVWPRYCCATIRRSASERLAVGCIRTRCDCQRGRVPTASSSVASPTVSECLRIRNDDTGDGLSFGDLCYCVLNPISSTYTNERTRYSCVMEHKLSD